MFQDDEWPALVGGPSSSPRLGPAGSRHHSALTAFRVPVHTPERAIAYTPAFAFSRRGDTRNFA
jgi:hypothetical protein